MAHKTLIGGTAYDITGGKTLIDGTAYEVGFGGPPVTITFKTLLNGGQTITIDGNTYDHNSGQPVITVPSGSIMEIKQTPTACDCGKSIGKESVYASNASVGGPPYTYTVSGNISITANQSSSSCRACGKKYYSQTIHITEI